MALTRRMCAGFTISARSRNILETRSAGPGSWTCLMKEWRAPWLRGGICPARKRSAQVPILNLIRSRITRRTGRLRILKQRVFHFHAVSDRENARFQSLLAIFEQDGAIRHLGRLGQTIVIEAPRVFYCRG